MKTENTAIKTESPAIKQSALKKGYIEWGIKLFFLIGYILVEFVFEDGGRSYYYELESLVLLSIILFGSFYCYHICPYGIIQEVFGKLGDKIFGKRRRKFQIPDKYDTWLRWLKYIFAAYFIYVIVSPNEVQYLGDHEVMYRHDYLTMTFIITKFLTISLVAMFLTRFFCRYMCYQKAVYNLLEKFSPVKIERDAAACTSCKICDKGCPMNIDVSQRQSIKSDKDCISCYHCIDRCPPKASAMSLKIGNYNVDPFKFMIGVALTYYILSWVWYVLRVESFLNF